MTTKTYSKRDSATAVLRKMGFKPRDYDLFITLTTAGQDRSSQFVVDLVKAHDYLARLSGKPSDTKPEDSKSADDQEVVKLEKAPKVQGVKKNLAKVVEDSGDKKSISQACRELILAGKTNQEVWDFVQPMFQLDDKKRGYPAWYRTELKNKGLLPRISGAAS